jgi:hypothetical protein
MRSPCCLCLRLLCISLIFFVFYAVRVVSKERGRLVLPRTYFYLFMVCFTVLSVGQAINVE